MCVVSLLQGIMFNLVPVLQGVDILGKTLFHCLFFSVVSVFPCLVVLGSMQNSKKHQVFKRHMSMAKVSNLKNKLCKQVV